VRRLSRRQLSFVRFQSSVGSLFAVTSLLRPLLGLLGVVIALMDSWRAEFKQWLGSTRLSPLVLTSESNRAAAQALVEDFVRSPLRTVLLATYELLRIYVPTLETSPIGLLICDEVCYTKDYGLRREGGRGCCAR